MELDLEYTYGQTPLDEDEKDGLLIESVSSRGDLDELEQLNIEKATHWTIENEFDREKILSEEFIKALHKRMLGDIWSWAGKFRKSGKNIGVDWKEIGIELRTLLDDTNYWIDHNTFDSDEIAIRFKHRLVNIHCFPNGNGRHSRLMADIIRISIFKKDAFNWKYSNMVTPDETRKDYITAIKEADRGNIEPLLNFAKEPGI